MARKKVIVLGGDGMLGHQLLRSWVGSYDLHATYRKPQNAYSETALTEGVKGFFQVDAEEFGTVEAVLREVEPQVVINAIGIVKQQDGARDAVKSICVNSLFPHRVAALLDDIEGRFITISTDCVFSGVRGGYTESDVPDAADLYGKSKLLGEVSVGRSLTLRTSIIGLELYRNKSLIEWFLAQTGQVKGFAMARYTGLTTLELSRVIARLVDDFPVANGLYHLSSDPISKYDILIGLRDRLQRDVQISRDIDFVNDKSLISEKFRREFNYQPPSWNVMLDELAKQIMERRS